MGGGNSNARRVEVAEPEQNARKDPFLRPVCATAFEQDHLEKGARPADDEGHLTWQEKIEEKAY